MPDIFIIAGCNGAGKTTAAYNLLPDVFKTVEFVNADERSREYWPPSQGFRLSVTRPVLRGSPLGLSWPNTTATHAIRVFITNHRRLHRKLIALLGIRFILKPQLAIRIYFLSATVEFAWVVKRCAMSFLSC